MKRQEVLRPSRGSRYRTFMGRLSERHTLRGIPIALLWPTSAERETLLTKLDSALALIETFDKHRFRCLRRDVRLVWTIGVHAGCWIQSDRIVLIGLKYALDQATMPAEIASTLVHELTHARLDRIGCGYSESERASVEHTCHRAELAFARRLPDPGDLIDHAQYHLARDLAE